MRGVRRLATQGISVRPREVRVSLRFLVATLGSAFDGGRLLEREARAVGVGLGAAGPALKGRRGFHPGDIFLSVPGGVPRRSLAVALQTDTKYTLTENSYIRGKRSFLHSQNTQRCEMLTKSADYNTESPSSLNMTTLIKSCGFKLDNMENVC